MKGEKYRQAEELWFQTDMTATQIAETVKVDRRTLYNWVSKSNWKALKKSAEHIPAMIAEHFYYQLQNINETILERPYYKAFPTEGEMDVITRLTAAIKKLKNRQSVNESMQTFASFAEALFNDDPELAKSIGPHIRKYIKGRKEFDLNECLLDKHARYPKKIDPFAGDQLNYQMELHFPDQAE